MPEGPFGFPRLTNIGPFTEVEAEQEFNREITEGAVGSDIDREIATIHNIDLDTVDRVTAELIVRTNKDNIGEGILASIREEFGILAREETITAMQYWMDTHEEVGKIITVGTRETFRNMGLATQLKEQELDYMESKGINLVYTDVVSEGGYRLAKKTDFRPIDELDEIRNQESVLQFNRSRNRGIMFKTL